VRRCYYLAYGSILHPLRLGERISSAQLCGVTTLRGYRLAWHKRGADGSGKCDLVRTNREQDRAHGAKPSTPLNGAAGAPASEFEA